MTSGFVERSWIPWGRAVLLGELELAQRPPVLEGLTQRSTTSTSFLFSFFQRWPIFSSTAWSVRISSSLKCATSRSMSGPSLSVGFSKPRTTWTSRSALRISWTTSGENALPFPCAPPTSTKVISAYVVFFGWKIDAS